MGFNLIALYRAYGLQPETDDLLVNQPCIVSSGPYITCLLAIAIILGKCH
jgi:hypothetical protein